MQGPLAEVGDAVRLLDIDPDLTRSVPTADVDAAVAASSAATLTLRPGVWARADRFSPDVGLYLINGFVARRSRLKVGWSAELLGPNQLLLPAFPGGENDLVGTSDWRVLSPAWLAILDPSFQQAMAPYQAVTWALLKRCVRRSRGLSIQLAGAANTSLRERILLVLWHLAGSYGRVGRRGVILEVPLSHELLAEMVAATRPAVSKRIKQLERDGRLSQRDGPGFVLHGRYEPPDGGRRG